MNLDKARAQKLKGYCMVMKSASSPLTTPLPASLPSEICVQLSPNVAPLPPAASPPVRHFDQANNNLESERPSAERGMMFYCCRL